MKETNFEVFIFLGKFPSLSFNPTSKKPEKGCPEEHCEFCIFLYNYAQTSYLVYLCTHLLFPQNSEGLMYLPQCLGCTRYAVNVELMIE